MSGILIMTNNSLIWRNWREAAEGSAMMSFITCTVQQILLRWSSQGGCGGPVMCHSWETRDTHILAPKSEGKRPLARPRRRWWDIRMDLKSRSVSRPGYGLDDRGSIPGRVWLGIFLSATASRPALEPTQPPVQCVSGVLPLGVGVKRPWREGDHSPSSSAEVKNAWRYTSSSQYFFIASCLITHRTHIHGVGRGA
jgi:hypothetical protein